MRSLMMKALPGLCSAALFFAAANPAAAALIITPEPTGAGLAAVIQGPGVTINPLSITYQGTATQSGIFTGGISAGIGIESGILLTSGTATSAQGTPPGNNSSDGTSTQTGGSGDAQLSALAGQATFDAAVLQFDFTTTGGNLFFNYVFASEEYNESVFANNDVFAFFLDGVNIALIPGTSTPVSINTVNRIVNSTFYNNNDPSDTSTPFANEYDGFTDVFTAVAPGVRAGNHFVKIAIADGGDRNVDSGVFIQAGTFSDQPSVVPEPGSMTLLLGLGVLGMAASKGGHSDLLRKKECPLTIACRDYRSSWL